jgi:glycosyltransferase involved in cell wall biosynthesis
MPVTITSIQPPPPICLDPEEPMMRHARGYMLRKWLGVNSGGGVDGSRDHGAGDPPSVDTERSIRAVAIMHLPGVSGPSRSLENELEWLAGRGQLEVFLPGDGRLRPEFDRFAQVRTLSYSTLMAPTGPESLIAAIPRFRREVRSLRAAISRVQPDLVLVTSALLPTALLAASIGGVRSILYAGEILDEPRISSERRALAGRALLQLAARSTAGIIACSDRVARQYSVRGARNVTTIHPPIGPRYGEGDGDRFRRTHGIPAGAPLVVAVGAITHGRGQDVLIRALYMVQGSIPDVHLAIVGEPHPREQDLEYARNIARLGDALVPGAVTFTGFEEHVEDAYAAASVVVNPARYEAFGRVAFEALLAGQPVVSTSIGAVPELLHNGVDALLVPTERPRALATAVAEVLSDGDLASRLADSGRARAQAELNPSASLAAFRAQIDNVLEGRNGEGREHRDLRTSPVDA